MELRLMKWSPTRVLVVGYCTIIFTNLKFVFILKIEGVIKIMKKEILITKEMLLVWNVRNVEEKNIAKMGL